MFWMGLVLDGGDIIVVGQTEIKAGILTVFISKI